MLILLNFLLVLPEIIASVLTLISPLIPNTVIGAFVVIAIAKLFFELRLDLDSDFKATLLMIATSLFYDTGLMLKFLSGDASSVSDLKESFISVSLGVFIGFVTCKLIYSELIQRMNSSKLSVLSFRSAIILNIVIFFLYLVRHTDNGDGSIFIIGGLTFQLPELLKLELIVYSYIGSLLIAKDRRGIVLLYIPAALVVVIICVEFKEFGSTLLTIYFTLIVGFLLAIMAQKHKIIKGHFTKMWNVVTSSKLPLSLGSMFFIFIGMLKRILFYQYPVRGEAGEYLYRDDDGKIDKMFGISSRLSADAAQIHSAIESFKVTWPIQLNLNTELSIPNATPKTAVADYAFVVVAQAFGKYVAPLLFILFAVCLIASVWRRGDFLAKAGVTMLLLQIFVQLSGIVLHFCFTGLTIPFLSAGGSSTLSSFAIFTLILYSIRRHENEK
ncbi:FtsW/RodA/SpoVE family cell cycle protein [Ruminococcus flavefaciens]|uniref:FtsW/RodA/SpoVE family cell cycle protein n=1 Tax=Ruminococcus flavefaciens TaxID=1265 RepID=UPI0026EAB449|nr:FtsW/RodA/SpoVE family cell cycle protein [Ruminococcus flavefaciens]